MQQHGLLQEHILFSRVQERMQGTISCFQSGFMRDVADPHLCLYELGCLFLSRKQPLLLFMADLVKAFPRTWRAYLVNAIHEAAGIRGGAMSLFHSILSSDEWLIPLSGLSWEKFLTGFRKVVELGRRVSIFFQTLWFLCCLKKDVVWHSGQKCQPRGNPAPGRAAEPRTLQ